MIRTPWDYQQDAAGFLRTLEAIDSATHLENSLSLCRWNLHKTYLRDLGRQGIAIVPTRWSNGDVPDAGLFDELGVDELVVKPVVSANADDWFADRPWLAQPFMPHVVAEGEYSLFYFGGRYSHAVLKTPRREDFRVQEEHGGVIQLIPAVGLFHFSGIVLLNPLPVLAFSHAREALRSEGRARTFLHRPG